MSYICREEYIRPHGKATHPKPLEEKAVVKVTDLHRRQAEQDRMAALPFTFEERVLKRALPGPANSRHTFPQKNVNTLLPEVEYKPYEPKQYAAYDYGERRVDTLNNDDWRKDYQANVIAQGKKYDDFFSPQRGAHLSKAIIREKIDTGVPSIFGFKDLGRHSPDPLPNGRIKKQPFDKVVPPWLTTAASDALPPVRVPGRVNPSVTSAAVGSCFHYTDGYTVPDMMPMPKTAIDIQRVGGNLITNPNQIVHVQRHRKLVPTPSVQVTAPSPQGATMLQRRDTTMQLFFHHPKEGAQRRAHSSMLP